MEFHEIRARNCGRSDNPTLISRQKVPKMTEPHPVHGQVAKRTVLNVFGTAVQGYFINDQLGVSYSYNTAGRTAIVFMCIDYT
jgi:DUF1126 PH-like domain